MDFLNSLLDWAKSNDTTLWWLFAMSAAAFLVTPLAVGWMLVRLPQDYFTQEEHHPLESWDKRPVLRMMVLVARNLLGIALVLAGLAMLLVPGQGLLTIAVGLILTDFPGKFRLQQWIVKRPSVWRSINWLRKRAGRSQLERPH